MISKDWIKFGRIGLINTALDDAKSKFGCDRLHVLVVGL